MTTTARLALSDLAPGAAELGRDFVAANARRNLAKHRAHLRTDRTRRADHARWAAEWAWRLAVLDDAPAFASADPGDHPPVPGGGGDAMKVRRRPVPQFPVSYYDDPVTGPVARALHVVLEPTLSVAIVCPPAPALTVYST